MEKISVSIRVRPLDKQEAAKGSPWKINNNTITLCSSSGAPLPNQAYIFDHVFDTDSTTFDIYRATTEDIVASAVKGFNGTVFAYGQTSSGKTFTMRGTEDTPGIIPLAIHDVFKNLEQAGDREFLLRMSYMEIYNEDINDLLAPEQIKLQVHESLERGIFVAGLREEIVVNPEQVLQLMEFGEAHRHIGETNMNLHSSRSHSIFRMVIESRDKSQDDSVGFSCDAVRVSVLNLVDLAGSERVAKTGAEGARLKEGTHINKSLMVLGTVINKLSEGIQNQGGHVPYRDSKLTRILQPALGGNARTAVICNITPAMVHVDESRGTLQFASRAICVTNCAQVNEILTDAALLKRQKKEIEELRSKLRESHSEHFEEEILTLRNTLLKSECERERIALELQEEKRAHAERERKQAQKIENLSTLVLNSAVDERDFEKRFKKNARRETWCPRVTTGDILDEDVRKPLKEEKWAAQSRDRLFPMPPPFESLLEEDESFNGKDAMEVQEASPEDQERHGADNDKDSDGSCGALPDPSARIHVADRKRKHRSEMPSVSEGRNDFQMSAVDSGMDKIESVSGLKEVERDCQSQEIDNFDSMHYKEEGDRQIFMDDGMAKTNPNDLMVQQLSQELSKAREEVLQHKYQLALASEELEQLKNQMKMSAKDANQDVESLVNNLKREKEELAIQLTEAYLQFEEEKAAWVAVDRPGELARNISMTQAPEDAERVKFLEEKLLESQEEACAVKFLAEKEGLERLNTLNEVVALREKLADRERELERLKASEVAKELSLEEDCNGTLISENLVGLELSVDVPEGKPKEASELTDDVHIKSQGKGGGDLTSVEATEPGLFLATAHCGPNNDCDDRESMILEIKESREKICKLESLIVDLKSEKVENVLQLNHFKSEMEELAKDAAAAKSVADQERMERVSEAANMQDKINELEAKFLQEKALREMESGEVRDLRMKLMSMQESLAQRETEFIKDRWSIKTEILKLQVGLDATLARAEVFHGRFLEAQDELKDAYEELEQIKGLNKNENKQGLVNAETSKIEMPNASVSDAACDNSLKQINPDAATDGCIREQNSSAQELASCTTGQNSLILTGKQRTQAFEKEHINRSVVGLQGDCKLEETKISSSGNLAQTVSFAMRSIAMKKQEHDSAAGEAQVQSRPRSSTLNGNTAGGNRVTSEADSMSSMSRSGISGAGLKPLKALIVQKNPSRSKGWPANIQNKENR